MMSLEQIEKLANNPFYQMSPEEKDMLENSRKQKINVSLVRADSKKKLSTSIGNATVKEIGKLSKAHGDPTSE